jgi:hypothetical protein
MNSIMKPMLTSKFTPPLSILEELSTNSRSFKEIANPENIYEIWNKTKSIMSFVFMETEESAFRVPSGIQNPFWKTIATS